MQHVPRFSRSTVILTTAFWAAFLVLPAAADTEPAGIFLTWQRDPLTTMTIDWHTIPGEKADTTLRYKTVGSDSWKSVTAKSHPFPHSDRTVHRVELTGLEPATEYRFQVGEFERKYMFRTMPAQLHEPLRFAAGGDTAFGEMFQRVNRVAMNYEPDFIVWGGDLAYCDSRADRLSRWVSWFERVRDDLITAEGRVVPIVLAIGNHEMTDHHYPSSDMKGFLAREGEIGESTREWREANATYFYGLFAFPGHPGYGVLDFGDYLSLISLDSSHSNLIRGRQTDWLREVLKARQHMAHIMPVYHKPAYPSHRVTAPGQRTQIWSEQVLKHWVPLFEQHGVRIALEHDDHAYKRTFPLLEGKIDPRGIVYIGDGAWGVAARAPKPPEAVWYLKRSESANHAIIVTLHGGHQHFLMVDDKGEVFDEYPATPGHRNRSVANPR
jgi:acid phosphatase type 7